MFQTTTLDFYDDSGHLLRRSLPDLSGVPSFVKTAAKISQDFSNQSFALVVLDEGKALKKFATYDQGNTWLSGFYFDQTHDLLPPEAEKIAAANLLHAFQAYGLRPSETLQKVASQYDGEFPPRSNLYTGSMEPQRVIRQRQGVEHYAVEKTASAARYPLDTLDQVKQAMDYFLEKEAMFTPAQRWEFCTNVAERARMYGVAAHEKVAHYAGNDYGALFYDGIGARGGFLKNREDEEGLEALTKIAHMHKTASPATVAQALETLDTETGLKRMWGTDIPDPYETVFGGHVKVAEKIWNIGTLRVTERQLRRLTEEHHARLNEMLGTDLATPLMKDPVVVFESLPTPLKETIARMATDADASL